MSRMQAFSIGEEFDAVEQGAQRLCPCFGNAIAEVVEAFGFHCRLILWSWRWKSLNHLKLPSGFSAEKMLIVFFQIGLLHPSNLRVKVKGSSE